jgi:multidrug efflux system membrane fusion protein
MTRPARAPAAAITRLALLLGPATLAACSSGGGAAERQAARGPAVPVRVATVVQKEAPVVVPAIGRVEAYSTVDVRSQVEGRLAEVHFAEGQEVHRGALLFTIDPRPFEAALRQAEGNLARDRAQAENALVESGRFAALVKTGVVSRDAYDAARARASSLAAAVAADEAAVEAARIQLQYCWIASPLDGRIGRLLVHAGNVVKANETILTTINQLRPVHVEFAVPQQELPGIRAHMAADPLPVEATIPGADPGAASVTGTLSFVDNTVDPATGTVLLKAEFANQDERLWPGQFVNVALRVATQPNAIMVPARAVQAGQDGKFVFVVLPDDTVELRPVTVGSVLGDDAVVAEGLRAGERVVTEGQLRLAPGVHVEVKDEAAAAARGAA